MKAVEAISWMIILMLLIWLSREFKEQYQKNKDLKLRKKEKFADRISSVLAISHQYKNKNSNSHEFFLAVYKCLPFLNAEDTKEIYAILNDSVEEEKKIELLSSKLYDYLEYVSLQNNELFPLNTGAKALEYIVNRLKDIFFPILQAFVTFTLMGLILLIILGDGNDGVSTLKVITFLFLIMIPFLYLDLLIDKKLNKLGMISIVENLLFLILVLIEDSIALIIVYLLIAVLLLMILFTQGIKKDV